jgi:uncharacterized cupin superfamily protein
MSVREQLPDGRSFILNLEEGPIRPVHVELLPADHFGSLLMHSSEEAFVIVSRVPPGRSGPRPHWHDVDQLFCCVSGELNLRLGADEVVLIPGSLAVIPAGTRHAHHNAAQEAEIHLELLVPGVVPGRPIVQYADPDESWTERGQVVHPRPEIGADRGPLWIVRSGDDSDARWVCALVDIDARDSGTAMPDVGSAQRWYVIDGALEVTGTRFSGTAEASTVVALPAEVDARVRTSPGRRTRAIGFWPKLDPAAERALLTDLQGIGA